MSNNHGGCYENVCNAEHDYGDDDMMIDENENTHDEREKEMRIDISKNKNKIFTNKNYYDEKTVLLTDGKIEKKEKINRLSKMLLNYSMALNRSLGVVGGRSVTMPEGTISWWSDLKDQNAFLWMLHCYINHSSKSLKW